MPRPTRSATPADLTPGARVFYRSKGVDYPATVTRITGDPMSYEARNVWLSGPTILGGTRELDYFGCDLRIQTADLDAETDGQTDFVDFRTIAEGQRQTPCEPCDGSGRAPTDRSAVTWCPECGGRGWHAFTCPAEA